MKIFAYIFTISLMLASPAFAGWQSDLSAAIASGSADQIAAVGATYPDDQSAITLEMFTQAKSLLGTNPSTAVALYKAASTMATEVPSEKTAETVAAVKEFLAKAKNDEFQQKYPELAAVIFSASLQLAGLPNVVAVEPNLYEEVLVAANEFLDKKPIESADISALEDTVLLAQNAGFTPPGPTGANGAIADPQSTFAAPSEGPPEVSAE